jgi:tyrosine decarboxylase/aspartate 1-decarboxylase
MDFACTATQRTAAGNLGAETRRAFELLQEADSIVIDPHKHGLQPYGCGCVLFRDPAVARLYKHESPATYFSSKQLHLGEISLECSRPGAAAVALWATQKLLPLIKGGEFAKGLENCREAALAFYQAITGDKRFVAAFPPELDILVYAPRAGSVSQASELARQIFDAAAKRNLHLALAELPVEFFQNGMGGWKQDRTSLTCLRSVLMKPEHKDWIGRIWEILSESTEDVLKG